MNRFNKYAFSYKIITILAGLTLLNGFAYGNGGGEPNRLIRQKAKTERPKETPASEIENNSELSLDQIVKIRANNIFSHEGKDNIAKNSPGRADLLNEMVKFPEQLAKDLIRTNKVTITKAGELINVLRFLPSTNARQRFTDVATALENIIKKYYSATIPNFEMPERVGAFWTTEIIYALAAQTFEALAQEQAHKSDEELKQYDEIYNGPKWAPLKDTPKEEKTIKEKTIEFKFPSLAIVSKTTKKTMGLLADIINGKKDGQQLKFSTTVKIFFDLKNGIVTYQHIYDVNGKITTSKEHNRAFQWVEQPVQPKKKNGEGPS